MLLFSIFISALDGNFVKDSMNVDLDYLPFAMDEVLFQSTGFADFGFKPHLAFFALRIRREPASH
jgi:hypothetical protein